MGLIIRPIGMLMLLIGTRLGRVAYGSVGAQRDGSPHVFSSVATR